MTDAGSFSDAHHFVIRCLDMFPGNAPFQLCVHHTLFDFSQDCATNFLQDLATRLIFRISPLVRKHSSPSDHRDATLQILLTIQHSLLFKLGAHKTWERRALPQASLDALQLTNLAKTLIHLLNLGNVPAPVNWGRFIIIVESLTWISYFDPTAVRDIPSKDGVLLFVALMHNPSISVRCKGLLGLLNICHQSLMPDTRFCDPQHMWHVRGFSTAEVFFRKNVRTDSEAYLKRFTPLTEEQIAELYRDPEIKAYSDEGDVFDPYKAALKYIEFELQGPKNPGEPWYHQFVRFPATREYSDEYDDELFTSMEVALRYHGKNYEADVLKLGHHVRLLAQFKIEGGPDTLKIDAFHILVRVYAEQGLKKWPDHCYFYYAKVKSQMGPEYVEWATKGTQCADCTPFLKGQILYEVALNMFSVGVTHVALDDGQTEWWRIGAKCLRSRRQGLWGSDALKA